MLAYRFSSVSRLFCSRSVVDALQEISVCAFSVSSLCECGLFHTAFSFAEHSMEASRLSAVE